MRVRGLRRFAHAAAPMLPRPACCGSLHPARLTNRRRRWAPSRWWSCRRPRWMDNDAGMSTAEYALGTLAACAFAALLYKVLTSAAVRGLLEGAVRRALTLVG